MTQLEGPTTSITTPLANSDPGESWENPGQASGPGQFEGDDGGWENEEFFDNVQRATHVNDGSLIRAYLFTPFPRPARVQEDQDPQPPLITTEDVIKGAVKGTVFIARYSLDVFSNALHWLTWPLAVLVALWFLATIFSYISLQLSSAFPLCILPGISWSGMCQPLNTPENWSFPGLSEANPCVLEPRAFPPKLAKSAQGFPNLENNSQGPTQLHSFKSTWEFTAPSLFTLHPNILPT